MLTVAIIAIGIATVAYIWYLMYIKPSRKPNLVGNDWDEIVEWGAMFILKRTLLMLRTETKDIQDVMFIPEKFGDFEVAAGFLAAFRPGYYPCLVITRQNI